MFKNKKALIEKKNDLITRAEKLVNTAEDEKRELTEDEAAELAEIRDDVKKIKTILETMNDLDDGREPMPPKGGNPEPSPDNKPSEEQRELNERKAFEAYIRGVVLNERATNLTEGDNGAVIPKSIAKKIIETVYDICPVLEKSDRYNVKGDLSIPYYDETTTSITTAWATEFTALTSTSGTFKSINLKDYLAGALTKVSRSLINNSDFDIVSFVVRKMAESIARFVENVILNGGGSGNSNVKGLTTAPVGVTAAAQTAITADEVIKLKDSIKDVFQSNAFFVMNSKTRTALRLLKDNNGRYMLQDDINSAFGSTLLGKDVYVSDNMPEMAGGKTAIYYGDFSCLATKFTEDMNIQILRELFAAEHAVGVVGWIDFDTAVENVQGITALKMAE